MFFQYCLNVRNLYACGTPADIKVLVTTEETGQCPRGRGARPTVAVADKLNSSIFIRSKTPVYLVTTAQCASSTDSVPTPPASLLSRFWREQYRPKHFSPSSPTRVQVKILTGTVPSKTFQSQPTHPSTGQDSDGNSTVQNISVPAHPPEYRSRFWREQYRPKHFSPSSPTRVQVKILTGTVPSKTFQSQPTHPSTGQDSDGNSTVQNISVPAHPPEYRSRFVQGWVNTTQFSRGAVHSKNSFETRLHYLVNVTCSARNQAESSI